MHLNAFWCIQDVTVSTMVGLQGCSYSLKGLPQEVSDVVIAYCPRHGWTNYTGHGIGSSSEEHTFSMASPRRAISLEYRPASPEYTPTPMTPPEFLLRGTIAARNGAPPFHMRTGGGSSSIAAMAPPSFDEPALAPPPTPSTMLPYRRATMTTVANHRPRLCRNMIPTGHVSALAGGSGHHPSPSGEGKA